MSRRVRSLVFGVTDPGQLGEAAELGVDGVVVEIGPAPHAISAERATELVRSLPPGIDAMALLAPGRRLPRGFVNAATEGGERGVSGAFRHVLRIDADADASLPAAFDPDALWVRPRAEGSSAATRFDFRALERWGRRHRLILEVPDGAAGVEMVIRLGHPYALLFGDSVWFEPGILDLVQLEEALAVVARLNKLL